MKYFIFIFIYFIYNLIYLPIFLLIFSFYFFRKIFKQDRNLTDILDKIFICEHTKKKTKSRILIHGVSAGEIEISKILLPFLKVEDFEIFLSTSTDTGKIQAKKIVLDSSILLFPFDFILIIQKFLKTYQFDYIFLIEAEIWPNLILEAKKNNITIILISGQLSKKYLYLRIFFSNIFQKIDFFLMQSEEQKNLLLAFHIPEKKIFISNNLKWLIQRKSIPYSLSLSKEKKVLILGSSHSKEHFDILRMFFLLKKKIPNLFLIIVPRHIKEISKISHFIQKNKEKTVVFKTLEQLKKGMFQQSISLASFFGQLNEIYPLGHIIILGGSFQKNIGGHNIFEPLFQAKITIVGPYTFKFQGFIDIFKKNHAIIQFKTSISTHKNQIQLLKLISKIFRKYTTYSKQAQRAHLIIHNNQKHISKNLYQILKKSYPQIIHNKYSSL